MIDVSCIIINYNTSKYTYEAVASIVQKQQNSSLKYEIVVIDNASKTEDFTILSKNIKTINSGNIKLVKSKINLGFGAGNMFGVQHSSKCKYYAFINNDTLQVENDILGKLREFMLNNPIVGICSPQMLDENKNFMVTIDHFSSLQREILKRSLLEFLFPKIYLNRKKTYDHPTKVHYVQGSFMFTDATIFNDLGGFDENIFLYYEESDLSRRFLKQKNKHTYLVPNLEYIHYKGASTKKNITIKTEQKISLLYYIRKHFGWLHYHILIKYFIIRYFFTSFIKPKYWKMFLVLLAGAPIHKSLGQKQKVHEN